MLRLHRLATVALHLLGELVAPSGCAACDEAVGASTLFCRTCAASVERPPHVRGDALAAFEYGGAIATAVTRLKYESRADLAPRLGRAMLWATTELEGATDLVIPVPIHPRRLAERGYNQAALLAGPVARGIDVRFAPRALSRTRHTPRQASIDDRVTRLANVAGAFAVREHSLVEGARVLLVDDVRTTGATLDACSDVLKGAGAASVRTLVLAVRA